MMIVGSTIKSHQNGQPSVLFNLPWIPKQVLNRNGKGMKNLLKEVLLKEKNTTNPQEQIEA